MPQLSAVSYAPQLAFPGGPFRAVGFDPAHLAATGLVRNGGFSAVWNSGSFVDLLAGGVPFTKVSTAFPTAAIISPIGGAGLVDGTTKPVKTGTTSGTFTPTVCTYGAIVMFTGTGDNSFCAVVGYAAGQANQFGMNGSSKNIYIFNGSAAVSSFTLTLNVPYFIGASMHYASGVANHVATNLLTGVIQSSTVTVAGGAGSAINVNPRIGVDIGGSHYANAYIAAAMFNPKIFLSQQALQIWARDPWAFWYPPIKSQFLVGVASAPAFKAAWALNRNFINQGGVAT